MHRIILFLFSFGIWLLLLWPFSTGDRVREHQDIITGIVVSLLVALVMRGVNSKRFYLFFNPFRIFWFVVYLFVLVLNIVKANFDVAYRVLHPSMPIKPGVVKVKTKLRGAAALTFLANSITLTPGTHTIEATEDGVLYVHWLNVKTMDMDEASRIIVGRFEWVLHRIFK
jgi:multicomponent Na+:H+ antiporter subunit E